MAEAGEPAVQIWRAAAGEDHASLTELFLQTANLTFWEAVGLDMAWNRRARWRKDRPLAVLVLNNLIGSWTLFFRARENRCQVTLALRAA